MLGLKASHASWERKGLLLLPGKSLPGGEELSPERGQAKPSPSPSSLTWGVGASLARVSGCCWVEGGFHQLSSLSSGDSCEMSFLSAGT